VSDRIVQLEAYSTGKRVYVRAEAVDALQELPGDGKPQAIVTLRHHGGDLRVKGTGEELSRSLWGAEAK